MSDIFQEVEEDVRRDRLDKLWKKYGNYFIAAGAALVIGVAGYQLWIQWDRSRREAASDQFHAAELLAQSGQLANAETAFTKLADGGPKGYATLARFHEASIMLAEGKREAALAVFNGLAQLPDPQLSGAARLRIAWAQADIAPRADIEKTLASLNAVTNPWRYAAQEVLAYVSLRDGQRAAAATAYEQLASETQAPAGMRQRAQAIAEFLNANPDVNSVAPTAIAPTVTAPSPAPAPQETKPK